ncbi:MAG: hypothetical protein ACTTHI_00245 [Prevotella sp.]
MFFIDYYSEVQRAGQHSTSAIHISSSFQLIFFPFQKQRYYTAIATLFRLKINEFAT